MIDPPWPKRKGGPRKVRPAQGRELDYSTMAISDIFDLLDREFFRDDDGQIVAWMWTVDEFLARAETCMVKHGFRRHARMIWDKGNGPAPAFSVRFSHEYVLWFYRPKFSPVAPGVRGKYTTVIRAPAREHSRKPDEAYDMASDLWPNAERVDVFSREERSGWRTWGNQQNYF